MLQNRGSARKDECVCAGGRGRRGRGGGEGNRAKPEVKNDSGRKVQSNYAHSLPEFGIEPRIPESTFLQSQKTEYVSHPSVVAGPHR